MNYNQINRNSLMSCIYSDRPGYPYGQTPEGWKGSDQHLNPSKSKVNVRQSLNKTVENGPPTNPTLTNIRNSCLLTSAASAHPPRQDAFLEDKFFKAAKENQEPITNPREHFPRYSQVLPQPEERRKSQSAHFRAASSNDFLFKLEDFRPFELDRDKQDKLDRSEKAEKTQQGGEQLKEMILALTKRVASNEEEIARLKEREKRVGGLEGDVGEFKGKLFDLAKFHSRNFGQLQAKLQQQQQIMMEFRERLTTQPAEESSKRLNLLEHRVGELSDGLKSRQQADKHMNGQFFGLENALRKAINEEVAAIRNALQLSKKEAGDVANRVKRLEIDLAEKSNEDSRRSNKKSMTSLTLESKEILIVREGQLTRDRTRQLLIPQSSKREFPDESHYIDTPRREEQPRRELIIRQKVYFIDTSGYLLDENKYYLLNSKNQQILLPEALITALRENHMLAAPITPRR